MDYANKASFDKVIIVGEDEIKSGKFKVKNMNTGEVEKMVLQQVWQELLNKQQKWCIIGNGKMYKICIKDDIMRDINEKFYMDLISNLKIDCEKCFGFCCSALYFAKAEGFPEDKVAGKPCMNLKEDFKCKIHKSLSKKGVKGCTTFECFGAGQKIAQDTYKGESWLDNKEKASEMFDAFVKMMQLHEMLWYLAEAYRIERKDKEREAIKKIIDETINFKKSIDLHAA